MRVGGQLHALAALLPGKRPGIHCKGGWVGPRAGLEAGWAPGPVWRRAEHLAPTGMRSRTVQPVA